MGGGAASGGTCITGESFTDPFESSEGGSEYECSDIDEEWVEIIGDANVDENRIVCV
jgi:hypothetical protein